MNRFAALAVATILVTGCGSRPRSSSVFNESSLRRQAPAPGQVPATAPHPCPVALPSRAGRAWFTATFTGCTVGETRSTSRSTASPPQPCVHRRARQRPPQRRRQPPPSPPRRPRQPPQPPQQQQHTTTTTSSTTSTTSTGAAESTTGVIGLRLPQQQQPVGTGVAVAGLTAPTQPAASTPSWRWGRPAV